MPYIFSGASLVGQSRMPEKLPIRTWYSFFVGKKTTELLSRAQVTQAHLTHIIHKELAKLYNKKGRWYAEGMLLTIGLISATSNCG